MGYSFDPTGNTADEIRRKKEYGYMNFPQFTAGIDRFCCYACGAFRKDKKSPTGFRCAKYNFPDEPAGCCNGYYPTPGLIKDDRVPNEAR